MDFVITVEMSEEAFDRYLGLVADSEACNLPLPEWKAGLAFCAWWRRHGVKMSLRTWTTRRAMQG